MANAVIPRIQGDEYQARVFWIEAVRLFANPGVVTEVCFEVDGVRGFDDVAVFYGGQHASGTDPQIRADYFQVKFHVSQAGVFTAAALIDPAFIAAERYSLLQRLRDAQRRHAPTGTEARFTVVSPWSIDPEDPLVTIVGNKSGEVRLEVLAKGGPGSRMGKVRKTWREHLELTTDEELYTVLRCLRIRSDYPTLDGLLDQLNPLLVNAGLKPYTDGRLVHEYDTLPAKLMQEGKKCFNRESLKEVLSSQSLLLPKVPHVSRQARQLGIRSFSRWAEHMEDETDRMLCLLHRFDGRSIRERKLWDVSVLPELTAFLTEAVTNARGVDIHLDTHSSIAFAAGWILDPKSGVAASPVQRSIKNGRETWCVADCSPYRDPEVWSVQRIDLSETGTDVALVLNVARTAILEAESFVRNHVTSAGMIISLTPCTGTGSGGVRDAAHARRLADEAALRVQEVLATHPREARVHVFAAAPNGLMFFLGQAAHAWGRCLLYEYDFEHEADLPYAPSIQLPSPT